VYRPRAAEIPVNQQRLSFSSASKLPENRSEYNGLSGELECCLAGIVRKLKAGAA
jgi:hypothetical protein